MTCFIPSENEEKNTPVCGLAAAGGATGLSGVSTHSGSEATGPRSRSNLQFHHHFLPLHHCLRRGFPAGPPSDCRVEPFGPSWCQRDGPIGRSEQLLSAPFRPTVTTLVSLLFCLKCGFMLYFLLLQHKSTRDVCRGGTSGKTPRADEPAAVHTCQHVVSCTAIICARRWSQTLRYRNKWVVHEAELSSSELLIGSAHCCTGHTHTPCAPFLLFVCL